MAGAFLTETDLMARWGISRAALDRLVESNRLPATERDGERAFDEDQVEALAQTAGGEAFIGYDEVLQELQLNRSELDELIGSGKLTQYQFGGEPRFEFSEVETLSAQKEPTGMERKPTDSVVGLDKQPTVAEETAEPEPERAAPTELDIEQAEPAEEEEEALFDFSEELAGEPEEAAEVQPGAEPLAPEAAEGEMITDVLEVGEMEKAEEDLLGDIIEDVGGDAGGLEDLVEEEEAATGEDTVGVTTDEVTAEITQMEEEAFEGEELEEILEAEEEVPAAEEEFEVPYGAPIAREAEAPLPTWVVVLLALALVAQVVAGVFVVQNAASAEFSAGPASAANVSSR